jgi:hypothetical protein
VIPGSVTANSIQPDSSGLLGLSCWDVALQSLNGCVLGSSRVSADASTLLFLAEPLQPLQALNRIFAKALLTEVTIS